MRLVAVTGATGYVGGELLRKDLERDPLALLIGFGISRKW